MDEMLKYQAPGFNAVVVCLIATMATDSGFAQLPDPAIERPGLVGDTLLDIQSPIPPMEQERDFFNASLHVEGLSEQEFSQKIAAIYASLLEDQEPLGAEFEAIWDANTDQLYES